MQTATAGFRLCAAQRAPHSIHPDRQQATAEARPLHALRLQCAAVQCAVCIVRHFFILLPGLQASHFDRLELTDTQHHHRLARLGSCLSAVICNAPFVQFIPLPPFALCVLQCPSVLPCVVRTSTENEPGCTLRVYAVLYNIRTPRPRPGPPHRTAIEPEPARLGGKAQHTNTRSAAHHPSRRRTARMTA